MQDPDLNILTDRDTDEDDYRSAVNGDEAVGGSTAVPSQNDTEELAEAVGIEIEEGSPLAIEETIERRDRDRWELDPDSAAKE
jgi:Tfp pilus assembly PilM family ATPase